MYSHRYPLGFGLLKLELIAALLAASVWLVMLALLGARFLGRRRRSSSR
ncbi:hypothetical protein [Halotalea alkalilenta]|nr:hypothetical protein [Halotalea alkalilenta]